MSRKIWLLSGALLAVATTGWFVFSETARWVSERTGQGGESGEGSQASSEQDLEDGKAGGASLAEADEPDDNGLSEDPLVRALTPRQASPMERLSEPEEKRFPGGRVLEAKETAGQIPGQITRIRILETDFKYPYLRTEETFDANTGAVISRREMVADHVLITLPEGTDPGSLLAAINLQDVTLQRAGPDSPLYRLHLPGASVEGFDQALEILEQVGGKEIGAEPDYVRQTLATPNDPKFTDGTLWGLNQGSDADIDAPEGWDVRSSANSILVAVIDTGIRYTHEDLAANMWRNPGEIPGNQIDDDNNGFVDDLHGLDAYSRDGDPMDSDSHGTHCAGTIGGVGNNGRGITGVAWNVRLMAARFLTSAGGTDSDAVLCIDYARAKGAKILSCSWGGGGPGASLSAAIERARAAGIIMVAAAGNDGSNNDVWPTYPASYPHDNIVSVAATTSTETLAGFSNFGATSVDLGAPGSRIYSAVSNTDTSYDAFSGTSMATPHVAGALALLVAQFPNDSVTSRIQRLIASTDPIPALAGKSRGGRLNLARALGNTSIPLPPPPPPANDGFVSARRLAGTQGLVTADSTHATAETREPYHAGRPPAKSVWFAWTAPGRGSVTWLTQGSAFDTLLAVYRGSGLTSLTSVASNDDAASDLSSRVSFSTEPGVTYWMAVDGYAGAGGLISLRYQFSPTTVPNDGFAAATRCTGNSFAVAGRNQGATVESGEPRHAWVAGGRSVWWTWTAPARGRLRLATAGSSFDTLLAVYTGARVNALSYVVANDDAAADYSSRVEFEVQPGVTYRIAVDGYGGATGAIRLAGVFQPTTQLPAPTGLRASQDTGGRLQVNCGSVASASWYEAEILVNGNFWANVTSLTPSYRTPYRIEEGVYLTIRVRVVSLNGTPGLWSAPISYVTR